jgi:hypothetical protein
VIQRGSLLAAWADACCELFTWPAEQEPGRLDLRHRERRGVGFTLIRFTMSCPSANPLLVPDARHSIANAWRGYPHLYDQVLEEVHARLNSAGYATKLDLAALIAWKHVRNAPWMQDVLKSPPLAVQQRTQAASA